MMDEKGTGSLFVSHLCGFFRAIEGKPLFSDFLRCDKDGQIETASCLVPIDSDSTIEGEMKSFHPRLRRFLAGGGIRHYRLHPRLQEELVRTKWLVELSKSMTSRHESILTEFENREYLEFSILGIRALEFQDHFLAVSVEISIPPPKRDPASHVLAAKLLLNNLCLGAASVSPEHGPPSASIRRMSNKDQADSARRRFSDPRNPPLLRAFCGDSVTFAALLSGIPANASEFLMSDRFAPFSIIVTPWDGESEAFDTAVRRDLVRLSHAFGDAYLPSDAWTQPGTQFMRLFENVVFAMSLEGAACWLRPRGDQVFLQDQYLIRLRAVHYMLFLLVHYQRHALLGMAHQLAETVDQTGSYEALTALQEARPLPAELDAARQKLRRLRSKIASSKLRSFFQQVSVLTTHQQFYKYMQDAVELPQLIDGVQGEIRELEQITQEISNHYEAVNSERKARELQETSNQHLFKMQQILDSNHKTERSLLVLTLLAEVSAMPYYLYHSVEDVFNQALLKAVFGRHLDPHAVAVGIWVVTALVVIWTLYQALWARGARPRAHAQDGSLTPRAK